MWLPIFAFSAFYICILLGKRSHSESQAGKRLRNRNHLAGWWYTYPSENMKVNWDDDIPNIWENKPVMFQSPPTSLLTTINPL